MSRSATRLPKLAPTHRVVHGLAAWLSIVAFVCASLGFRINPERVGACGLIVGAERFPCEGCDCGCATAEHCWTHCCCHSLEGRLAWAESNGVAVPCALVPAAFARLQARAQQASLPPCCRTAHADAPCCAQAAHPLKLPVVSALGCKGATGWLVPHHAAVASPLPVAITLASHAPSDRVEPFAGHAPNASLAPASPPPKA